MYPLLVFKLWSAMFAGSYRLLDLLVIENPKDDKVLPSLIY